MKLFRRLLRQRAAPNLTPAPFVAASPEAEAAWDREDERYAIDATADLDGLGLMKALAVHRHRPISGTLATIGRRYSMLHRDVLTLLYYLARKTEGDILEIGPYIGGSTIAEAYGARAAGRRRALVTVENGGQMDHPTLPSRDIVADLKRNLAASGVADLVQIVVGAATAEKTGAEVRRYLGREGVGLLVMDADGEVRPALAAYRDLLIDRCWVVIDDYYAPVGTAEEKGAKTKADVDALVAAGELETMGYYGWGTWFGRWHRSIADGSGRT
jgi:predicted O-methyltransferase YrrM